jgi:hypothetical protein
MSREEEVTMLTNVPRTATDVGALPAVLDVLQATPPPGGRVLSVYLDTGPERAAGQGYLLAYRDHCKVLRELLPPTEQEPFAAAAAQVEQYLTDDLDPRHPGMALFGSGRPGYFYAVPLPARPAEDVRWGPAPAVEPLQAVLDDFERVAVLLFDKARARLFTVYLGAIEERQAFTDEVPGKQATGDWFALSQTRYARHHEDHVLRHAKRAVAALMALLRARPFDRLLLGGPDEALALLRHHLPRPLRARVAGTLGLELFASEATVLQATLEAATALEGQAETAAVTELLAAATTPHVALGLRATLAALNAGRVHRLFLADHFAAIGGACPRCGHLVVGLDRCPTCGTEHTAVADLRELVAARGLAQGARVEIVSGEAAALLRLHDGLGAWTRY